MYPPEILKNNCSVENTDFLFIRTPNTGQMNSLFHTFVESRPISGLPRYNSIYYWLAASVQFSPNHIFSQTTILDPSQNLLQWPNTVLLKP